MVKAMKTMHNEITGSAKGNRMPEKKFMGLPLDGANYCLRGLERPLKQ